VSVLGNAVGPGSAEELESVNDDVPVHNNAHAWICRKAHVSVYIGKYMYAPV
jgi:hypothetical protein